ncbi:SWIM zinc finger family protein [Chryseobacterium sp. sg2396]|uniref:SWIM zinc finger family protein n=1 Tax=Chryseobacterium sp. sg2396 TaxID=3276280 RepID=UPI00366A7AC7
MLFEYKFHKNTAVANSATSTQMSFSPDLQRDPTFFVGKLNKKLPFREAISALHDVVVSDLRFKPKDRAEYHEWVAEQEKLWLSDYMAAFQVEEIRKRMAEVREELDLVYKDKNRILGPFNTAKKAYFDYLYQKDRDAWFVLDPVITVHPDEVFFECFSQDESTYGKLSSSYNVFTEISEFKYGTTNIDYSASLYNEFQKIRGYKDTEFKIDPSGFEALTTNEEVYKEEKIDLPDSWVRGFLQVSSAMTLPATAFDLHPMDIFSICQFLRRFKEKKGPRALRFILEPGKPVQAVFEPWYETLTFHRSVYTGTESKTIRIWGRRRLLTLERLIPIAKNFRVILMGSGLPSFYIADLGDMAFTLGLSGWTTNDWSRAGNFDLMAPRGNVDLLTQEKVFNTLKETWFGTPAELARKLNLDTAAVSSSLTSYTQAGRVIYDLNLGVYRVRELTQDPLDMSRLRFSSPQEEKASQLIASDKVKIRYNVEDDILKIEGTVQESQATYQTAAFIDKDQRLTDGSCQCGFYRTNGLRQGPCEHILATRMMINKKH